MRGAPRHSGPGETATWNFLQFDPGQAVPRHGRRRPTSCCRSSGKGSSPASLYALIALGFVLIYKSSRIFNFAQGIMVVFAALTLVGLHEMGVPALLALPLTLGVMFVLASRHRARRAAPAGQPARHHPVHGHDRHHAVPDRLRRDDLRRREQAHDHRANSTSRPAATSSSRSAASSRSSSAT